jgi:transcriptional regulator with XRE-family HTH domain
VTKLEQLRRRRGMSQFDLAATAGVSISTIYKLEHGRAERVRPKNARLIAEALSVAPEDVDELRPTLGLPPAGDDEGKARAA